MYIHDIIVWLNIQWYYIVINIVCWWLPSIVYPFIIFVTVYNFSIVYRKVYPKVCPSVCLSCFFFLVFDLSCCYKWGRQLCLHHPYIHSHSLVHLFIHSSIQIFLHHSGWRFFYRVIKRVECLVGWMAKIKSLFSVLNWEQVFRVFTLVFFFFLFILYCFIFSILYSLRDVIYENYK